MADFDLLPPTLSALQQVKDKPQGTESANLLDDYLRQTRNWLYEFLSLYIDPSTGKIRPSAFGSGTSLPAGVVRGTNPVGNLQREIVQGSVQGVDLADGAVTGSKIAPGTITASNIADATITGAKLAAGSVTSTNIAVGVFSTSNLADASVTGQKIAVNTITGDKLTDGSITEAKLAPRSAVGNNLPLATEGQILVGGSGATGQDMAVKTLTGVIKIDAQGVSTFNASLFGNALTYAKVVEEAGIGVDANNAAITANFWYRRGSGVIGLPIWSITNATRDFLEVGIEGQIHFKEGGRYLIRASAPARASSGTGIDQHRVILGYRPDPGNNASARAYFGSVEDCEDSVQTRSFVEALIDVSHPTTVANRPYIFLSHAAANSGGAGNFGLASGISAVPPGLPATFTMREVYAEITILKVQEDTEGL